MVRKQHSRLARTRAGGVGPRFWTTLGAACIAACGLLTGTGNAEPVPSSATLPLRERFATHAIHADLTFDVTEDQDYSVVRRRWREAGLEPAVSGALTLSPRDARTPSPPTSAHLERTDGGSTAIRFTEELAWVEWVVHVRTRGLYRIRAAYAPLPGSGAPAQRALSIDSVVPYAEARTLCFPRRWRDEAEPRLNNIGDQIRPRQIELAGWSSVALTDTTGTYAGPLSFFLEEGTHTIRLSYVDQPMLLGALEILAPTRPRAYAEVAATYGDAHADVTAPARRIQAESNALWKTDPTIRRETDGDPQCEPLSRGDIKLNVIGGWRWRKGNQAITWSLSVPEDGLYRIGLRCAQVWGDGLPVFRQIEIDGAVPFRELEVVRFGYERQWRLDTLSDSSGAPLLFRLSRGEHTITMRVTLEPYADAIHRLRYDALRLSELVRQIVMITGRDPDIHFDYELGTRVPNLLPDFGSIAANLEETALFLTGLSGRRPSIANSFLLVHDQLTDMVRDPESIPRRLQDLTSAQESLGMWLVSGLQDQPLLVDYFLVGPPGAAWERRHGGLRGVLATTWFNFVRSFTKDYDSVGDRAETTAEAQVLNVWIARGREWAELIKDMADQSFTPSSAVHVNLNVFPSSQLNSGAVNVLMLAIASGQAPDVACAVGALSPVEFAIRGAVEDLSRFPDYRQVAGRFAPAILTPLSYRGGSYALPETMEFSLLFYRRDLLARLGVSLPTTWDELYEEVLPVLHQNGMQFYVPPGGAFGTLLFQRGGDLYDSTGTHSALDTPQAFEAFKEWTDLYVSYAVPVSVNLFSRIRTGETPLGVGGYNLYVQLSVAAPELLGRWSVAPMPGHRRADGSVDRTVSGIASDAAVILSQSRKKESAWLFLKWWTSADVQLQFGRELEALIGVEARWNTANLEALSRSSWDRGHLAIIGEQARRSREAPVVLGGYFTSRHLTNAWTRVVMEKVNLRDSLEQAVRDIDTELRSKQEEYGVAPGGSGRSGG
jgi:ABC-type glycerol-3-phosphate transport system substrate-binding protein